MNTNRFSQFRTLEFAISCGPFTRDTSMRRFRNIRTYRILIRAQFQPVNMKSRNFHWIWTLSSDWSIFWSRANIVCNNFWSKMMLLFPVFCSSGELLKRHRNKTLINPKRTFLSFSLHIFFILFTIKVIKTCLLIQSQAPTCTQVNSTAVFNIYRCQMRLRCLIFDFLLKFTLANQPQILPTEQQFWWEGG